VAIVKTSKSGRYIFLLIERLIDEEF